MQKAGGKKTVSFEKSVSFSDDPPAPPGILSKKGDGGGRGGGRVGPRQAEQRAGQQQQQPEESRSGERKKQDRHAAVSMEPELYNQLRGLQKSARELRQVSKTVIRKNFDTFSVSKQIICILAICCAFKTYISVLV